MASPTPATAKPASAPMTSATPPKLRPTGVTVLGVLQYIAAALTILAGVAGGLGAAFVLIAPAGWFALLAGLAVVLLGILVIYLARATMAGVPWAWTASLVLTILWGLTGLASLFTMPGSGLVTLVVAGGVVWYLYTPEALAWFDKGHLQAPWAGKRPAA